MKMILLMWVRNDMMLEVLVVSDFAFLARASRPAAAVEKTIVVAAKLDGNGREYALLMASEDLAEVSYRR